MIHVSHNTKGDIMTKSELMARLNGVDGNKQIICIIDGDTYNVSDVYVWDEVSDDPKESPIEILLDM